MPKMGFQVIQLKNGTKDEPFFSKKIATHDQRVFSSKQLKERRIKTIFSFHILYT